MLSSQTWSSLYACAFCTRVRVSATATAYCAAFTNIPSDYFIWTECALSHGQLRRRGHLKSTWGLPPPPLSYGSTCGIVKTDDKFTGNHPHSTLIVSSWYLTKYTIIQILNNVIFTKKFFWQQSPHSHTAFGLGAPPQNPHRKPSLPWLRTCSQSALLSLIHIWRCRRSYACRSRWSPFH